jgi:hypothetical protein
VVTFSSGVGFPSLAATSSEQGGDYPTLAECYKVAAVDAAQKLQE